MIEKLMDCSRGNDVLTIRKGLIVMIMPLIGIPTVHISPKNAWVHEIIIFT